MAKDPAALFFIDKWLVATAEMRADCRGWYLNLVLHQYDKKTLPSDIEELANLAGVRISEFKMFQQVWEQVLKHKFEVLPTGRVQDIEAAEIIRGRDGFKDKRAAAGRMSAFIQFIRKKLCKDENVIAFVKNNVDPELILTSDQQVFQQVFKEMLQLYINTNKNTNQDRVVRGMGEDEEGEGEPEIPPPDWTQFPGPKIKLDLPDVKADAALEMLLINGAKALPSHIPRLWKVFKTQYFTGFKFYRHPNDVFSHFINWSKSQKVNGLHQQAGGRGKDAALYDAVDSFNQKFGPGAGPGVTGEVCR